MLNPRVEIGVALAFAAAILWGLYQTSQIDLAFSSDLETFSGPRAYPGLILIAMLTLCLAIAGAQFRGLMRGSDDESDHHTFLDKRVCWSAGLLVALCVFILAFERIGYVLTMVPLLTLVAVLCGAKSVLRSALVSAALAALCLVIFRYGLSTVLPDGILSIDNMF